MEKTVGGWNSDLDSYRESMDGGVSPEEIRHAAEILESAGLM